MKLPNEIICRIISLLKIDDAICLCLTCHYMLHFLPFVKELYEKRPIIKTVEGDSSSAFLMEGLNVIEGKYFPNFSSLRGIKRINYGMALTFQLECNCSKQRKHVGEIKIKNGYGNSVTIYLYDGRRRITKNDIV